MNGIAFSLKNSFHQFQVGFYVINHQNRWCPLFFHQPESRTHNRIKASGIKKVKFFFENRMLCMKPNLILKDLEILEYFDTCIITAGLVIEIVYK